jgi:hypothetical protein
VKNTGNIDGGFEIYFKISFSSPIFFNYKVTDPYNFKNIYFGTKLFFPLFLVFFWVEEREEVVKFQLRE